MALLSIVAMGAVILLSVTIWQRSGRRRRVAIVEAARVLIVSVVLFFAWQPESLVPVRQDQLRDLVILVDHTDSMQTSDALGNQQRERLSRLSAANALMESAAWDDLDSRIRRRVIPFGDQDGGRSDLAAAMRQACADHPDSLAMVMVSDGQWNRGRSPIDQVLQDSLQFADAWQMHTVCVGSEQRLPDIQLMQTQIPAFAVVDRSIGIPISLRNRFSTTQSISVRLVAENEQGSVTEVATQAVQVSANGRYDGRLQWQSSQAGTYQLTVDVPELPGESDPNNNRFSRQVVVRPEALKVLVIESRPRWEFRYLRNALIRDPGIDVQCLLYQPDLKGQGGGGKDYIEQFPQVAEQLAGFDVIFVGDVPLQTSTDGQKGLSVKQAEQLADLVRQQACGLVLMPGPRGLQQSLQGSALAALFPVEMDVARPKGSGAEQPGAFVLSRAGRESLLTQLSADPKDNWSVWESLPGFYWHAAALRAKPGSQVLAVHADKVNSFGRVPLLATRSAGAGKVLYMGTDSAWRWRMGVEDKYHYRFWGQVIRWMAYQRNMVVGQRMRLSYQPEEPDAGVPVAFRASIMTVDGQPLQEPTVELIAQSSDGGELRFQLQSADQGWGVYNGDFAFPKVGRWTVRLQTPPGQPPAAKPLETEIVVNELAADGIGEPARRDIMNEIARVGGGQSFEITDAAGLVATANQALASDQQIKRIQWWNHPAVMLTLIAGLSLFWVGRKWAGAI